MRIALLIATAALVAVAGPALAKSDGPSLLGPSDLDAALVLPPPPATGSPQAAAELAELHAVERARSAADVADAERDGDTKNGTIFMDALGPGFDLSRLPATARLLETVRASEKAVVDRGKTHFARPRPYIADPSLRSCKRNDDPLSSYPSGHTTMAFAMGETLAKLVPSKAAAILTRAQRYGQSRIVCGQHYRSDVTAGETLGALISDRLAEKPEFEALMVVAAQELARSGFASNVAPPLGTSRSDVPLPDRDAAPTASVVGSGPAAGAFPAQPPFRPR